MAGARRAGASAAGGGGGVEARGVGGGTRGREGVGICVGRWLGDGGGARGRGRGVDDVGLCGGRVGGIGVGERVRAGRVCPRVAGRVWVCGVGNVLRRGSVRARAGGQRRVRTLAGGGWRAHAAILRVHSLRRRNSTRARRSAGCSAGARAWAPLSAGGGMRAAGERGKAQSR